ncbi:MAG: PTS transporter subunit EIIC, partial [Elusimicrobiaceae bacterium]|nr:PTS transporter subunit EIIC [Elusimicrobiaceae bacterium]
NRIIADTKAIVRRQYSSRISAMCGRIGNIFLPLIPAYIGCGLLIGIGNILSKTLLASCPNITALIGIMGQSVFLYLMAIVGYNANKEFGGSPALGLAFAGILNAPALTHITLFGWNFAPGKGGVLAVLLVCWVGSWVERKLRARLKGSTEMFLTPMLTILIVGTVSLLLIQPLAGSAADGLALFTQWLLAHGGLWVGAFLGGTFLPLVMMGIHQSLIPIHQQLLDVLGSNPLFPILCMAGAGQVGASLAVLLKTKNTRFKTVIKNAIPVGLLGIGEPLIYGVTLPLF